MYSLLQKCSGMACNLEDSVKNLKHVAGQVSIACRGAVTSLIARQLLSSADSDEKFKQTIADLGHTRVSELDLKYARLAVRVAEKEYFVNSFSIDSQKNCILHVAKALPPLVHDLRMVADVSGLLSAFFKMILSAQAAVMGHDKMHSRDPNGYVSDAENIAIVNNIEKEFGKLVTEVYPMLIKTAKLQSNAKAPHLLIGKFD